MSEFSTPAGWYPDGSGWERRWDGSQWTEDRRQAAAPTQVRPATPAPSSPPFGGAPQGPPPQGPPPQGPPQGQPQGPPPGAHQNYGHVPSGGIGGPPNPPIAPAPHNGGFGGYGQQGGHFGGYPPNRPPKSSKLWLWITLAVALVLGVAAVTTLVVVKPWSDDSTPAKDPDKGSERAIQGDITGDGKGDVAYYLSYNYDNVKKITATSNGKTFDTTEIAVDKSSEPNELWFDWDGDAVNDKLNWKFIESGKQITLSSNDSDFPGDQNFTISIASLKEYGVRIQVTAGDYDGDGDQDLAIVNPNERVVDVSILANDGKGTFAAPALWLSIPNATIDTTQVVSGDFDNDGDADLWAQLPMDRLTEEDYTGYYSGQSGFALLKSDGKAFELGGINELTESLDTLLVGDVVGDGTTNIIGIDASAYEKKITVSVFDVSSGRLEAVPGLIGTSDIGDRYLEGVTLSDVDGDRDADVVFVVKGSEETSFAGVQVMASTGAVFDKALVWAETPSCPDNRCDLEFVGSD